MNEELTIAEIAGASPDFSILVEALEAAELDATVADPGADLTVFAPTNAAFAALAADLAFEGDGGDPDAVFGFLAERLADFDANGDAIALLTNILLHHVSPGARTVAAITDRAVATAEGGTILPTAEGIFDDDPGIADPDFVSGLTNIAAANGRVHAIDRVLLPVNLRQPAPRETITDIVEASGEGFDGDGTDFDVLSAAIGAAGLDVAIDDLRADLTVFAPTDDAFVALARTLGSEATTEEEAFADIAATLGTLNGDADPVPLLTDILTYHVALGVQTRSELAAGPDLATVFGPAPATAGRTLGDGDVAQEDPAFIDAASDIVAADGLIHAIDGVLLPGAFASGETQGTGADETFLLTPTAVALDAGGGEDTVLVGAGLGAAAIAPDGSGGFTVALGQDGDGGTATLAGVERFVFDDATLVADTSEAAAIAFRLFGAAFGRDPDAAGAAYWTDRIEDRGVGAIADAFVVSDEFAAIYGADPDPDPFVEDLYEEVLGRQADAAGLAYWSERVDGPDFDFSDLLLAFSESAEYRAATAGDTEGGVLLLA